MHDADYYDTDDDFAHAGEEPGRGLFKCTKCGHALELQGREESLPLCQHCGGMEWEIMALFKSTSAWESSS